MAVRGRRPLARGAGRVLAAGALLALALGAGCGGERGRRGEAAARAGWADDGALHVVICGSGSGLPAPGRAGPCTAVLGAGRLLLVDAGPGSWRNVVLWGLPREALSGVLLTRLDAGHVGDLGEAAVGSRVAGRTSPLPVHGPPGVGRVVAGF
ncbi:MAG: MBL fold metallo-hydrolase, partial [Myxococcota bacterium]|nr:MBL fold metallo-hydrolase [Myxococcota bacterium]